MNKNSICSFQLDEKSIRGSLNGALPLLHTGLLITNGCNLRCIHCSVSSTNPSEDELTTSEAKKLLDEALDLGLMRLAISGGEPFLRKDLLKILKNIDFEELGIVINTNATLMSKETAEKLSELNNLIGITVSLDGATAKTHEFIRGFGTFPKVLTGIRKLVDHGIQTAVTCVYSKHNLHELWEIASISCNLGIRVLRYLSLKPVGRGKNLKNLLLDPVEEFKAINEIAQISKYYRGKMKVYANSPPALIPADTLESFDYSTGCPVSITLLEILPKGEVVPCTTFGDLGFTLGNIRNTNLSQIWNDSLLLKRIRKCINPDTLQGVCGRCKLRYSCIGYCRAGAYREYGKLDAPFGLCQKLYELNLFPRRWLEE